MKRKLWIATGIVAFCGLLVFLAVYDYVGTLIIISLIAYCVGGYYAGRLRASRNR